MMMMVVIMKRKCAPIREGGGARNRASTRRVRLPSGHHLCRIWPGGQVCMMGGSFMRPGRGGRPSHVAAAPAHVESRPRLLATTTTLFLVAECHICVCKNYVVVPEYLYGGIHLLTLKSICRSWKERRKVPACASTGLPFFL